MHRKLNSNIRKTKFCPFIQLAFLTKAKIRHFGGTVCPREIFYTRKNAQVSGLQTSSLQVCSQAVDKLCSPLLVPSCCNKFARTIC